MLTKFDWTVFVSQTGTEVYDICNSLGILPSTFITSNYTKLSPKVEEFLWENKVETYIIPRNPKAHNYMQDYILNRKLITLHGFLRILPAEFINAYQGTIYNGHPGLITEYPELKGKDPQIKAWEGKYPLIGSVVHEVTPEVDEGKIVRVMQCTNTAETLDEMYNLLKGTSLSAWSRFLTQKLELTHI